MMRGFSGPHACYGRKLERRVAEKIPGKDRLLKTLGVLAALLSVSPSWAQETETAGADTTRHVRSPTGAMLRSLALPGWGQFYNGRAVKGGVIATAEVGSAVAFFVDRFRNGGTSNRNPFLISTFAILFYSVADAYVDAHLDAVVWIDVEDSAQSRMKMKLRLGMKF